MSEAYLVAMSCAAQPKPADETAWHATAATKISSASSRLST